MIETIFFKGENYPKFQSEGFAAKFAFPFAEQLCKGIGVDIGCNRNEWKYKDAIGIDPNLENCDYDAYNFPYDNLDYIFSSHCLEHLPDFTKALEYWNSKLRSGGVLFLYLPDLDTQKYWRVWSNRKHLFHTSPNVLKMYFEDNLDKWRNIFVSGTDLNNSFYAVAEKI